MEAIATGGLRELASQGSGWALFVITAIGFLLYFIRTQAEIRKDRKEREELQEKRIVHVTACMDKIERHLAAIERLAQK